MRAVNLMPEGGGSRPGVSSPMALVNPANGLIALLVVVLALVTVYVLSSNSVASRQSQLSALQLQVQTVQAQANQLTNYVAYQRLAQQRVTTVQQIASARFDWHTALSNLARVVPANTAFQSLLATAGPGTSVSGAGGSVGGGAGTSSLRSDIPAPAFEVKGCSVSHDDVARLLSRLRAMPGVQRVTLADSVKTEGATGGTATAGTVANQGAGTVCGRTPANFDLVVFFTPLPGAGAATPTTPGSAPALRVTTPGGAAAAASGAATGAHRAAGAAPPAAGAQPVSTGSPG